MKFGNNKIRFKKKKRGAGRSATVIGVLLLLSVLAGALYLRSNNGSGGSAGEESAPIG